MNNWREFLFKINGFWFKMLIFFFICIIVEGDYAESAVRAILPWLTFLFMFEYIIVEPEKIRLKIKSKIDERKIEISRNRRLIKENRDLLNLYKLKTDWDEDLKKKNIKVSEDLIKLKNEKNTLCRKELKFLENVKIPLISFNHRDAIDKINETLRRQKT